MEPVIDLQAIDALLPHSGAMCLLDCVVDWDDGQVCCEAHSHRFPENPLRANGELPVYAGIEYAAQAMAIHGTLCAQRERPGSQPQVGYLAVLSNVDWQCSRLDDLPGSLQITATRLAATAKSLNYAFSVAHQAQLVLSGEAMVVLQDTRS